MDGERNEDQETRSNDGLVPERLYPVRGNWAKLQMIALGSQALSQSLGSASSQRTHSKTVRQPLQ